MKRKKWNILITLICVIMTAVALILSKVSGGSANRPAAYLISAAVLLFGYGVIAPAIGK